LNGVNLSILPIVNPSGWRNKTRLNADGDNVNRGYCHPEFKDHLSKEGELLVSYQSMLIEKSRHGFLSLHEDNDDTGFYMYSLEREMYPTAFTHDVLLTGIKRFGISENSDPEIGNMVNGVIFNECDGTFEDMLYHRGILRSVCTETPGQRELKDRINTNVDIINTFVNYKEGF
jgi:hypothetical protein